MVPWARAASVGEGVRVVDEGGGGTGGSDEPVCQRGQGMRWPQDDRGQVFLVDVSCVEEFGDRGPCFDQDTLR
jgi:hypothetical protein